VYKEIAPYLSTPLGLLAREVRREGCDAILCQQYEYPRFDACVLLGQVMRRPVFATYQGGGDKQLGCIEAMLRPLALRACSGLIIATRPEIRRVRLRYGLPPRKLARIFNPVDVSSCRAIDRDGARAVIGIPLDAQVVVWHGRVEFGQKGVDILLDAWDRVCRERPERDLRLLLVGTGSDAEELGRRIATMGLRGVLWIDKFVNDRDAIRCYLSAADVYAFPSRSEGFPVAPIEAMACGLPVVAAEAQGVSDIFEGGEASGGLVVPCGDAGALALALGRVLDDEPWGRELGARARRRVEVSFSLEAVGEQLRAFISGRGGLGGPVSLDVDSGMADLDPVEPALFLQAIAPMQARARSGFNVQLGGQSALAITAEHASPGTLVVMDEKLLVTTYGGSSFLTALVPKKMLKRPSRHLVYLTDGVRKSNPAEFVVQAEEPTGPAVVSNATAPDSGPLALLEIAPAETRAGEAFNLQPNGQSALSIMCENALPGTIVVIGDTRLPTTYGGPAWLTAELPPELYRRPSRYQVYLVHGTGASNRVEFAVKP
jgi:glycosyltransferase involved in cell wall biosynthesis